MTRDPEAEFEIAPFRVIVDTREQAPFQFRSLKTKTGLPLVVPAETKTLKSGDYSIAGLEDVLAIERKSLADLYGTLSAGRERFVREMERLTEMVVEAEKSGDRGYAAVVVEASWGRVKGQPPPHSRVSPESIVGTITAFAQRYRVGWWFYPTRGIAEEETYRHLSRFYFDTLKGRDDGAADSHVSDAR